MNGPAAPTPDRPAPPSAPDAAAPPPALDVAVLAEAPGRSRLDRRRVAHPWSLGRGYPGADGLLSVIPQVAAAGLLGGDGVLQRVEVGQGAGLRLVSAGAMVVHGGGGPARSRWHWRLGPGARAVQAAEAHVLLPGAALDLDTEIVIDPAAVFLGVEGVCRPGPDPAAWRAETRVRRPDGTLLLVDRQDADAEALDRLARLPGAPAAFATLLLLGPPETWGALPAGPLDLPGAWGAAAPLRAGAGMAARLAAPDGGALRRATTALLTRTAAALGLSASALS